MLSKFAPWRSASENWERAERELARTRLSALPVEIWRWCGFSEKKGWDWLDFLARLSVPVVIAGVGWYITGQSAFQQQAINQRNQEDLVVSEYIKTLQSLVLDKNLKKARPGEPVAVIARSLTLTSLARLQIARDGELSQNKRQLLQFLREAGLIERKGQNVSLVNADLSGADLGLADLSGADLSRTNLRRASLSGANLSSTNLSGAVLGGAENLDAADRRWPELTTSLTATLGTGSQANLASLLPFVARSWSILGRAYHSWVDHRRAFPLGADLRGADLRSADLRRADLRDVRWDAETRWPERSNFAGAKNIPEALKKQLGL